MPLHKSEGRIDLDSNNQSNGENGVTAKGDKTKSNKLARAKNQRLIKSVQAEKHIKSLTLN